jgi:hypothetical protein
MSYGLHWEWRGFGRLDPSARKRIEQLPRWNVASEVVDCYVWWPGLAVNLKLRQWGGGESLKLKRLWRRDETLDVELWEERPEEEYLLPIAPEALDSIFAELGWGHVNVDSPADRLVLEDLLVHAAPGVRLIEVAKHRQTFATSVGHLPVRIELADITVPESLTSIGIEDHGGLGERSSGEELQRGCDAVCTVRDELDLNLESRSYLDALAFWARGTRLVSDI